MRGLAVTASGVVLAVGLIGTGLGYGVDRDRYLASNAALLADLPAYPGARLVAIRTLPYHSGDSAWSPVVGYTTLAFFRLPRGADRFRVAAFYERELAAAWTLVERIVDEPTYAAGPILNFRRGRAGVSINLESWRGGLLEIAVDRGE